MPGGDMADLVAQNPGKLRFVSGQRHQPAGDIDIAAGNGESVDRGAVEHGKGPTRGWLLRDPRDALADLVHIAGDPGVLVDAAELGDDLRVVLIALVLFRGRAHGAGLGRQPGPAAVGGLAGRQHHGAKTQYRTQRHLSKGPGNPHPSKLPCCRVSLSRPSFPGYSTRIDRNFLSQFQPGEAESSSGKRDLSYRAIPSLCEISDVARSIPDGTPAPETIERPIYQRHQYPDPPPYRPVFAYSSGMKAVAARGFLQ
jgi:hypothetical protein